MKPKGEYYPKFKREKLDIWRVQIKGWDWKQVAAAIDISECALSNIMAGRRSCPWWVLKRLCVLTGMNVGDLLEYEITAGV